MGDFAAKEKIAPPRFELGSEAPEAPMLDRYTMGLYIRNLSNYLYKTYFIPYYYEISKRKTQGTNK